jgi:hypothetical protein
MPRRLCRRLPGRNRHDFEETVEFLEVAGIAGVERKLTSKGSGCDEKIESASTARLTPRCGDCRVDATVRGFADRATYRQSHGQGTAVD